MSFSSTHIDPLISTGWNNNFFHLTLLTFFPLRVSRVATPRTPPQSILFSVWAFRQQRCYVSVRAHSEQMPPLNSIIVRTAAHPPVHDSNCCPDLFGKRKCDPCELINQIPASNQPSVLFGILLKI